MSERFPPIEELLLHRGRMLLLDRVMSFDQTCIAVEFIPRQKAWYVNREGGVPAWIGIEFMAQAVAAHIALVNRARHEPARLGLLLGTRHYAANRAAFAVGAALRIEAKELFRDESGLGAYECRIAIDGDPAAQATLKVYEPADPQQLIQEAK